MTQPLPQQRRSSLFRDDEPVLQGRALMPDASGPVFGDQEVWDFTTSLKRPANVHVSGWKVCFSIELEDPYWNLLAREFFMALSNPHHPAVLRHGVVLGAPADPQTLIQLASRLRTLARWGHKNNLSPQSGSWTADDLRQRIRDLAAGGTAKATVAGHVTALKALAMVEPALSLSWPAGDPWPGQSARTVVDLTTTGEISTPVVPPEAWFPLIRAAWAYIHTFAPDILRADQRLRELRTVAEPSVKGADSRLRAWLADPRNNVPVHAASVEGQAPRVNWHLMTLLLGYEGHRDTMLTNKQSTTSAGRRALIEDAVAAGRFTPHALTGELVQVTRPDGSTGPWHPGIGPRALIELKTALRDAAFSLVVGLSMMRDSEIHEILRESVVEHYSTPAIASTKIKGTTGRPGKHWWIADPVAEALAVAEAVSSHPDRVFAPVHITGPDGTIDGVKMLESFVAAVNAGRRWSGLDEIPPAYIRPHMFRRTMAMLTDQFPGSEIATGIQLKHLATRALANASTRGYAASDKNWAKYLQSALDSAKFRKIKDLYQRHTAGEEIGFGGGADRVKDAFDKITATVKARNGDARTAETLLNTARIHIRFGALNHCTADHANPVGAVCLDNAVVPEGHVGPLHERCRPDRCGNSMITSDHLPFYDSHGRKQLEIINNPRIPSVRRELAERELDTTNRVLTMAKGTHP
jgi:hypothetical protein